MESRAVELWSGFLYGQPIWPSSDYVVEEDFIALVQIHSFAERNKDNNAQDASIDAIRDIIRNHSSDLDDPFTHIFDRGDIISSPAKVLMDHVVDGDGDGDGEYGERVMHWTVYHLQRTPRRDDDPGHLAQELCKMYIQKTIRESNGQASPDLTARCRYHSHKKDELCYLEREQKLARKRKRDE